MDLSLDGKNALVCGSSKGIGKAAAIELAKLGANVTLVARDAAKLADTKAKLFDNGPQLHDYLVADFADSKDLRLKVMNLVARKPIHILINNTGGPSAGPIMDADENSLVQAFHNHVVCNQILAKLVVEGMKTEKYGRIINIISTSVREPLSDLGVSNTTRAAVANWSKSLANELGAFGITVNNVLPGFTNTARLQQIIEVRSKKAQITQEAQIEQMKASVPLGRFGQPEEIGAAIAFLASPAAAFITGTNLTVDGGRTKSS